MLESKTNSADFLAIGAVVAQRYRITERMGAGGDGVSYRAIDLGGEGRDSDAAGAEVLLKVYDVVGSWSGVNAWQREARALENLDHPAIPRCFAHRQLPSGELLMVRSFCPGKTLQQRIDAGQRLSTEQVQSFTEQMLEVLVYLQRLNPPVIHGDIKPSNVVLDDDGKVHLIDFAAVRETLRPRSFSGLGTGTVGYAAPEHAVGRGGVGSDLYSLGATLVHVLSHVHPSELPARGLQIDFEAHVQVEPWFGAWLSRLLEPQPEARFATASAARDAFRSRMHDEFDASARVPGSRAIEAAASSRSSATALANAATWLTPPADSRIGVSVQGQSLKLVVGGVGFWGRGVRGESTFLIVWTTFIGLFTATIVSGLSPGRWLPVLMMLPFWWIGYYFAVRLAFSMWGRTTVEIGPGGASVHKQLGAWSRRVKAPLARWSGARIAAVNGDHTTWHDCRITLGLDEIRFGEKLARVEQQWLVGLLNGWAENLGARAVEPQRLTG